MKKIFLAIAAGLILMACGGPRTPVDEICDIFKDYPAMIALNGEKAAKADYLRRIASVVEANKDYILTDSDKKKLVSTFSDIMKDYFKVAEKSGLVSSGELEFEKYKIDLMASWLRRQLDKAEKLSDLDGLDFDGKAAHTPVDKLLHALDEGKEFLVGGEKPTDEFEQKFEALFEENADYVLTAKDKAKICNKFGDLLSVAVKEAIKSKEIPQGMEGVLKAQMESTLSEIKEKINKVEKFGELEKVFD